MPNELAHQCNCPEHHHTSSTPPSESSSPEHIETEGIKEPTPAFVLDYDDDGDFREGQAQSYFETPSERIKNPNYQLHADRFHSVRHGASRDPSPHPHRTYSFVDDEEPKSSSIAQARGRPTLEVPLMVHQARGRSNSTALSVIPSSSQPQDDFQPGRG
jgi:hypothetical protein